jgi:hypothetical protein
MNLVIRLPAMLLVGLVSPTPVKPVGSTFRYNDSES